MSKEQTNNKIKYENLDSFIWWLNYKLKNDGLFEVNETNVECYLYELETQRKTLSINNHFILPCYATRSGNREIYKYETIVKDGTLVIRL